MDHFFSTSEHDEYNEKINLDELYDRKHEVEKTRLSIYNKILNRVHSKIKMASRQKDNPGFTFFIVPEFIFGIPKYNIETCISYVIDKLQDNGFIIKYTHPNLIYIYWGHYIPSYKRAQIKKETGQTVDGFGNIINEKDKKKDETNVNTMLLNTKKNKEDETSNQKNKKEYKDISTYKPQGIYNIDLISKIKDKIN